MRHENLTQRQQFELAHRRIAAVNEDFCFLVRAGMAREALQRNIERRPGPWGRFAGLL